MSGFAGGFLQGIGGGMQKRQDREFRQKQLSAMEAMGQQGGNVQQGMSLPMDVGPQGAMPADGASRPAAGQGSVPLSHSSPDRANTARMVYDSFVQEGFSPAQARALTAEINRENSLRPQYLYGSHTDPHNRATNVGMLSWQGDRATNAMNFLRERGHVGDDGRIAQTPEALRAQAAFLRHEMETIPAYARTREQFLSNPDVDYDTAHTVLGDNFIRWRRNDPQYRDSGYSRINEAYGLLDRTRDRTPEPPKAEKKPENKPWGWAHDLIKGAFQ